jgi:cyclopropane-fatty-acyl-phospholipid synthase
MGVTEMETHTKIDRSAAEIMGPTLTELLNGPPPVRFEFWDGSSLDAESGTGQQFTVRLTSTDALRRMAFAPGELGLARAFVVGDVETDDNIADVLRVMRRASGDIAVRPSTIKAIVQAANELKLLGRPPASPPEEMVPHGVRHSLRRDKQVVSHHYDVGNDFYEIVLGPSMTYSCARFVDDTVSLTDAQAAKHDLICRKLGLADDAFRTACSGRRPRVLDVGCGWGSMAMHTAQQHDCDVVGITISDEQAARARQRVHDAGLDDRVEIRVQDYREVTDGPFDAVSSIGMAEHVGKRRMRTYFDLLFGLLRPGGRVMNHAIASVGGTKIGRNSFVGRYVFPDGELLDLGDTILAMQAAGLEVRDVENLREHYAQTLRHWVANLEANWDDAVALVGEGRARVWQLYMSGSINGFADGGLQLEQTLGVRRHEDGSSGFARTREGWV